MEIESFGRERRRRNPGISKKYPGGTSIEKVNFPFSISKSKKSVINTANVIQFPIKLAFACTAHKIQGATIPKPMKLVIYVMDIWMAAVTYVMLSRICALWQLYILDEFDESKMYPHQQAIEELERLKNISINSNPTEWEKEDNGNFKIYSLNCRSLKKHFPDIISDDILMKSDVICLQETWLDDDTLRGDLDIANYELHLNSQGKGKGIAIYFKKETLRHQIDIKEENLQLSKFTSDVIELVVLYRSQNGDHKHLTQILETLLDSEKPLFVVGDFNFCFMGNSSNPTKKYFHENLFEQLVQEPTHIEGNLLDHAYMRDPKRVNKYKTELHSKYYTDHKGVAMLVKRFGVISPFQVYD